MRRRLKKRSQVRMSSDVDWGEAVGAVEAWRRCVEDARRAGVEGIRDVVDGREGCLVVCHGLSDVLEAVLLDLAWTDVRAMDRKVLSRAGFGAMRVAIVCLALF